jgi:cytochrome o ubiquinol oxidase subunit 3
MNVTEHTQEKVTFGFWVYLMSDCVLFAGLFATYAVLSSATYGGPSTGDIINLQFVLLETFALLTSTFTIGLARVAAQRGKVNLTFTFLALTLALGFVFLGMEVTEFSRLIAEGSGPQRSAFLSSFFALVGTHGLHVFFGSLWMAVLMAHLWLKGLKESTLRKLTILSLFWHFLDVIWIFIFTIVYMMGIL